jgi:membrane protein
VLPNLRERLAASYPGAVVQRFFALELLDRSFGLAAQAFVALLPLVIVIVSLMFSDPATTMSNAISDRFGLDAAARAAIRSLFSSSDAVVTISWLAVLMSVLSAFSLSRRLGRVYASIFGLAPLQRTQTWRGLVWVVLQVVLFVSASTLRDIRRDGGEVLTAVALVALLALWFAADFAGLRLLVPSAGRRLLVASAVTSMIGRLGLTAWAAIYFPTSLSEQAAQYGPIGVTFAIFTYILAGVLVYVCAPLLVTTWVAWRRGHVAPSVAE